MKIPYGKQEISDDDIKAVIEVLKSDFITQGPKIDEFEEQVANYHNCKYAVLFSNGTTALHTAYACLGVKTGDEIISPNITFVASSNGAVYCGAKPVLSDIDLATNNIDLSQIESKITNKTKVLCAVAMAGNPVFGKELREIANKHNLKLIFDNAHAIGSRRNGSFQIEFADFTVLSFHPVKHITTGEGGMLLTNDETLAKQAKIFRAHGIERENISIDGAWAYDMTTFGHNFRMSDINAALGISQFKRIKQNLLNRNLIAKTYNQAFANNNNLIVPPHFDLSFINENTDVSKLENLHSYHLYTLRLKDANKREALYHFLKENNIFCQIHYIPTSYFKFYQDNFGYTNEDFPNSKEYYNSEISLPMFHSMKNEEVSFVIEKVNEFFN